MRRVICLNKISKVGLDTLPKNYVITEDINDADAVLVRSANMLEMDFPKSLLAIARAGAGVNNIPLDKCAKQGIVVFNAPGANANAVKELSILGMLLTARDIVGGMKWVEDNKSNTNINKDMEKAKSAFAGNEVFGKTLGIIGLGNVGSLIAKAASDLGMHVVAIEPSKAVIERNRHILPKDVEIFDLHKDVYAVADYLSLNVPLLDATKGMINKDSIALMKDGIVIINNARDALVNDDDIEVALKSHKVKRYVTDFPNYRTANMEGVIKTPHLGASTEEAEDNCAVMAAHELVDYIENGNIINSVNYPFVDAGRKGEEIRVAIIVEGSENDVNLISDIVKKYGVIVKLASGIKGAYASMIFDLKGNVDKTKLLKELEEVKNIIKVRLL